MSSSIPTRSTTSTSATTCDIRPPMRQPTICGCLTPSPQSIDVAALRRERLTKLRRWIKKADYGAILLFDPYNQRYATGSRNMFGYFLRNSTRYFFVPAEGPIILFEYPQSYHVSTKLDTVDEARPSKLVWSSVSGKDNETAGPFAAEIADLMHEHAPGNRKIGLDRCSHLQALALEKHGLDVRDCQGEILKRSSRQDPGGGQMPADQHDGG